MHLYVVRGRSPPTLANLFKFQSKINRILPCLKILMEILPFIEIFRERFDSNIET